MRNWASRRVQAGETNIKAYVVLSGTSKYIDGLLTGLEPEALYQDSIEEAITGFEDMLDILKGQIGDDAVNPSAMDYCDSSGVNVTFDMELAVSSLLMQPPNFWIFADLELQGCIFRHNRHP
jgi:hypothetical protein